MESSPQHGAGMLYAGLSGYYDRFCAEIDYAGQAAFVARAFAALAASCGREHLDLACGSGRHLELLQAQGFVPSGLDNSPAMLALAAARCPEAELWLCDLAGFAQSERYDLITCLLYSIHYSHPVAALQETLQRAWQALKPGGVFIFNAVDASGVSNDCGVTTSAMDPDARLNFQSAWHYRGEGEVLDLTLTITRETAGTSEQWQDHHMMTALTLPRLLQLLQETGFETEVFEHDYSRLCRWNGKSFNAIVVARRPQLAGDG